MAFDLGNLLQQYMGGAQSANNTRPEEDFDRVAQEAVGVGAEEDGVGLGERLLLGGRGEMGTEDVRIVGVHDRPFDRPLHDQPLYDRPLRIALLAYRGNPFCGGQGVYIRHLSRELVALGHDVEVFSGQPYPADLDPRLIGDCGPQA